ncbi:acetylgalactosaminyl-O-glycosyl-glycoprotein beta-1,3-N-acetylglucosaminyltransferase-like [Haliotis rufescens]|uniref:acetylgalactosaminyl-O-glycosyl-glycoprotein beta-1,3-N-acetylglucosaminyltransferase-like n=1 Tax=Haliotis rufescens TaxID=6454 RepID=UPI00201F26AA|nr:acetylgalactosaminyl-O-glycosyl-glycoprotein beta-1,3-N-acetylglucosaminyltransferase-like [Haliotis rufescens]
MRRLRGWTGGYIVILTVIIVFILKAFIQPHRPLNVDCATDNFTCCTLRRTDWSHVQTRTTHTPSKVVDEIQFSVDSRLCKEKLKDDASLWLLVAVISAVTHFEQRQAIRATWGSAIHNNSSKPVCLVFILGTGQASDDVKLEDEISKHKDIVQINKKEIYTNLIYKSIGLLKWADAQFNHVHFVHKVDDDVYVHVPVLYERLIRFSTTPKIMMGYLDNGAPVFRNSKSKYYVSIDEFKGEKFPSYIHGPSYVISGDLVHDLLATIPHHPLVSMEDFYITGICGTYISAAHVGHCGFRNWRQRGDDSTLLPEVVSLHSMTPSQMYKTWNYQQTKIIERKLE